MLEIKPEDIVSVPEGSSPIDLTKTFKFKPTSASTHFSVLAENKHKLFLFTQNQPNATEHNRFLSTHKAFFLANLPEILMVNFDSQNVMNAIDITKLFVLIPFITSINDVFATDKETNEFYELTDVIVRSNIGHFAIIHKERDSFVISSDDSCTILNSWSDTIYYCLKGGFAPKLLVFSWNNQCLNNDVLIEDEEIIQLEKFARKTDNFTFIAGYRFMPKIYAQESEVRKIKLNKCVSCKVICKPGEELCSKCKIAKEPIKLWRCSDCLNKNNIAANICKNCNKQRDLKRVKSNLAEEPFRLAKKQSEKKFELKRNEVVKNKSASKTKKLEIDEEFNRSKKQFFNANAKKAPSKFSAKKEMSKLMKTNLARLKKMAKKA